MLIRAATVRDAGAICDVLRTSIIKLCKLDHGGDPEKLGAWLENKTVQNCESWITDARTNFFVAERNGSLLGVASINHDGYVGLCYLLPEATGCGLGARLLSAAEDSVLALGVESIRLESTLAAKGFYEHMGYVRTGRSENELLYEKAANSIPGETVHNP